MHDKVIIGGKDKPEICGYGASGIAHNILYCGKYDFYILRSEMFRDIDDLVIYKDCPEGIRITKLIKDKKSDRVIDTHIEKLMFKHIPFNEMRRAIKVKIDKSFCEGIRHQQGVVKEALGMR